MPRADNSETVCHCIAPLVWATNSGGGPEANEWIRCSRRGMGARATQSWSSHGALATLQTDIPRVSKSVEPTMGTSNVYLQCTRSMFTLLARSQVAPGDHDAREDGPHRLGERHVQDERDDRPGPGAGARRRDPDEEHEGQPPADTHGSPNFRYNFVNRCSRRECQRF